MATSTTPLTVAEEKGPPDLKAMRATVNRLLDPDGAADVLPPAGDELEMLIRNLRRHLRQILPEVEALAYKLDKDSIPRFCAFASVKEARERLHAGPSARYGGLPGHARRLARALNALVSHYEKLTGTAA
jgi:hypothetical protein